MGEKALRVALHTPEGVLTVRARHGQTVLEVIAEAGAAFSAPCGGYGRCGGCRVRIPSGAEPPDVREASLLGQEALTQGIRLACRARLAGDCAVFLPGAGMRVEISGMEGSADGLGPGVALGTVPFGGEAEASLTPTAGAQSAGDEALRHYGELGLPKGAPFWFIRRGGRVLDVFTARPRMLGLAADIGTTTLAARFYDLETGRLLGAEGAMNPQAAFGADVLSRIGACQTDPSAPARQQRAVVGALNGMVRAFCRKTGARPASIYDAVIAGNTTMLHLFAGLDPRGLGQAPFEGKSLFGEAVPAKSTGLILGPEAGAWLAPCVSAFVGGDITAGLLACGFGEGDEARLFLDLGTNGEMAFSKDGRLWCASVAAGPAFEGAHIRCGMGSMPGAVCTVRVRDGAVDVQTVDGAPAAGLCGSGLIDALAVMRALGVMDETGRILSPEEASGPVRAWLREIDGGPVFFLCRKDSSGGADVFVTQRDVREAQLAKGAVAAGVRCLLEAAGCTPEDVGRVFLAGGFGARLDPHAACAIGLLPRGLAERTRFVGNTSLSGASQALLSVRTRERLLALRGRCEPFELSGSPLFDALFVDAMGF